MGTIEDKLNHLINIKEGIRQEINRAYNTEEISTSDTFNSYIQKLEEHPFYTLQYIERSIKSVKLSNVTSIGTSTFQNCSSLTEVSFPNVTSIGSQAFDSCSKLITIYVGTNTSTVCALSSTSAFNNCTSLTNIYVPASLVDSYKSATNWSSYADKIKAVSTPMPIGPIPIGGKIFYDAGDNGATYTFYDSNGSVINDTSISGLQNAVKYKVEGNPTKDRFYAVYPSMLDSGNNVYWGFYYNADIKSSGGNIVNTGTAIGTGKTATQAILNYIDTYASKETSSTSKPSSDISQASPNGYNLYKNCGTKYNYLWDVLRAANNNYLEGHNDWFVPSKDEMSQIASSGVISDITSSSYLWSSSAYSSSDYAFYWYYIAGTGMVRGYRTFGYECVVCRAF